MININFLLDYINPIILGICLMVGFVLKEAFANFPNRFIPLVALTLGLIISIVINFSTGITAEVIIGGMISGLSSTGLYEMLRNLCSKSDSAKEE